MLNVGAPLLEYGSSLPRLQYLSLQPANLFLKLLVRFLCLDELSLLLTQPFIQELVIDGESTFQLSELLNLFLEVVQLVYKDAFELFIRVEMLGLQDKLLFVHIERLFELFVLGVHSVYLVS